MPYIGTQPLTGQFKKLDAITVVNGQAAYTMNYNSAAYKPATANALLVSVNGVIQAAEDAYTISGSTITFTENLVTGDTIDFIIALGDTGSAVTPVDGSVTTAKLANDAVTSDKLAHDLTVQTSLSVPTIKDGSGTNTAMTIDSSGRVLQPKKPSFLCRPTAAMSQATAGWRTLDFATVDHDVGSNLHADGYFVAPVDGVYHFDYNARLDAVGSGFVIIALAHNNTGTAPSGSALYSSTYFIIGSPNSSYDSLTTATTIELSANDKVVPWAYSADTTWTVSTSSSFSGFLVA